MSIYQLMNKILGCYALFLTVSGTILNLFNFVTCLRINKSSTFIYLAFFALANAFCLYWWCLNNFLKEFFLVDLLTVSVWVCRTGSYVQFSSLQISAWFLVLINLDRVFMVKPRAQSNEQIRRACVISLGLILFFLLLNMNILFKFGYETETGAVWCQEMDGVEESAWMTRWGQIHLMLYSVVPFLSLSLLDILLIYKLYKRKKALESRMHKSRYVKTRRRRSAQLEMMSKIALLMTVSYISCTLPIACASSFYARLVASDAGLFTIVLLDCLSFSFHGFNIIITYSFNHVFRDKVNRTLACKIR